MQWQYYYNAITRCKTIAEQGPPTSHMGRAGRRRARNAARAHANRL